MRARPTMGDLSVVNWVAIVGLSLLFTVFVGMGVFLWCRLIDFLVTGREWFEAHTQRTEDPELLEEVDDERG